ncbi:MAG: hypothetical protein NXI10_00405 [bacterium]|nr:hypothetical protein [bacterium]
MELVSNDPLTLDIIESGCVTWEDLVRSVRNFKYGRGEDRGDFESVWYRRMGTCSTKHGFLYQIAQLNELDSVELLVGIYLMTPENTPKVKDVLNSYQLDGIPEAHCYLKVGGTYVDATSNSSSYEKIASDILQERTVEPEFLITEKIQHHRKFLRSWLKLANAPYSEEKLWKIREECIAALTEA